MSAHTIAVPGVVRVLEEALARAKRGANVGVTVIEYAPDGSWNATSAGNVLRNPAAGVVAAQVLSSQFVRRIETETAGVTIPYPDRRS